MNIASALPPSSEMVELDRLKLCGENLSIKPTFPYLCMEFDKDNINPVNLVQALIPNFLECIRVLRRIGLNGYGHAIQITKEIGSFLDVAQHQALAAMLSVGHSTGYKGLEELAGVIPIPVRHGTLGKHGCGRWGLTSPRSHSAAFADQSHLHRRDWS